MEMLMIMLANSLFWGGALVAAVGGMALLGWALFSDRARGRRRCRKCWYAMDHALSLRCPECGHEATSDRALYRTRRRWRWAAVSLLPLLLAALLAVQPKVQRDGWGSIMPATVMILLLRIDDRQGVIEGIEYHMSDPNTVVPGLGIPAPIEGRLWRWQWRWLARSILMRMEHEARIGKRMKYHIWLAKSAAAGGNAALRQACMDALARELAHPDGDVRATAIFYSIDYEDIDGAIERAVGLLDHEDTQTRVSGVTILYIIAEESRQAVLAMIDALQHENAEVRRYALTYIYNQAKHRTPVPEALDPVHALEHDENDNVRYMRILMLANLQSDDDAWQTIDAALQHDDPHVRRGGLDAAAARQPRPAHVELRMIEFLDDPDADVRQTAARNLRSIDEDMLMQHADLLESFRRHDDPNVREAVARVLSSLQQR